MLNFFHNLEISISYLLSLQLNDIIISNSHHTSSINASKNNAISYLHGSNKIHIRNQLINYQIYKFVPMIYIVDLDISEDSQVNLIPKEDLISTPNFFYSLRNKYEIFSESEIYNAAKYNLQFQLMFFLKINLDIFCLTNPYKTSQIDQRFFKIGYYNFIPTENDIRLYIENPQFMWRFSTNNHISLVDLFAAKIKDHTSVPFVSLLNYSMDSSAILDYFVDYRYDGKIIDDVKKCKLVKIALDMDTDGSNDPKNIHNYLDILIEKNYNMIPKWLKEEFKFSYDYYLHQMDSSFTYKEFIKVIISGSSGVKEKKEGNDGKMEIFADMGGLAKIRAEIQSRLFLFKNKNSNLAKKGLAKLDVNEELRKVGLNEDLDSVDTPKSAVQYINSNGRVDAYTRMKHLFKLVEKYSKKQNEYKFEEEHDVQLDGSVYNTDTSYNVNGYNEKFHEDNSDKSIKDIFLKHS